MLILDPLLSVMAHSAEITRLDVMYYDAELPGELTTRCALAADVVDGVGLLFN